MLYDRLPTATWTRHHITLPGDSAHPMLQHIAQGACQALEDTICIADLVSHYRGDVQRAFPSYQEVPIPRTARAQLSVRLFGDIIHSNGITAPLRSKLFSQGVPDDFKYTDWFYSYQPESKETDDAH